MQRNNNLLLLHGALGTKDQFRLLKEHLPPYLKVHDLNFEGHGDRTSSEDFSMDLFTKNVIDFLVAKKIDKVNIFGYSMGGYVALNLAKKAPDSIEKIFTLGTKFDWTKESAEREIKMLNPEKMEEKVPDFVAKLAATHPSNNWKEVVHKTAKMMFKLGSEKKLTKEDLSQIHQDVLIGLGSQDKMVSMEESAEVASCLPNGTLKILNDTEHQIEKIDVKQLAEVITTFLEH